MIESGWIAGGTALIEGAGIRDYAVRVERGRIARVAPRAAAQNPRLLEPDQWLLPGLLDLQVNGGGGFMFNAAPERLGAILAAHRTHGVAAILPTLITGAPEMIARAAAAVQAHDGDAVLGLHLEGPFISPARPGIHRTALIRTMAEADVTMLCDCARRLAPRKLLLTLAPEAVEDQHLRTLASHAVVMAIGHSVASYERCRAALALGVRGFTHLWNAMPGPTARAPGPVVAALEQGFCGLIVDRVHVDAANLRLTLAARPGCQPFLVSDAMAVAGTGMQGFVLDGRPIRREGGRLVDDQGTLAGADLDLRTAVRHAVAWLGVPFEQAWSMGSEVPARFMGLEDRGRIAAGCVADLVIETPPRRDPHGDGSP